MANSIVNLNSCNLVYFDFETTGLSRKKDEIVQIAASFSDGQLQQNFNTYVVPSRAMHPEAERVTGLSVKYDRSARARYLEKHGVGRILTAVTPQIGLTNFINYLSELGKNGNGPVLLIGHNAHGFDILFLFRALESKFGADAKCGIKILLQVVDGIIDTKILFQKLYPGLPGGHNQQNLFGTFVGRNCQFNAHDAMGDVEALRKIVTAAGITNNQLIELGHKNIHELYQNYLTKKR